MNLLLIISGICIAIAAMVGIFAHSRDGAIWFTCAGVVFAVIAAFAWFQDTVWEHDRSKRASDVIPAPELPPPTPIQKEDRPVSPSPAFSPSASSIGLSPSEITRKIKEAGAYQEENVIRALIGLSVDWELPFSSASVFDGKRTFAWFEHRDKKAILPTLILCNIPTKGHERLALMNRTDVFRVRGIIESAMMYKIELKNGSIELQT